MEGNPILLFLVCYPIVGALVAYLIGRFSKKARDYMAQFITVTECLIFLILFLRFDNLGGVSFTLKDFCGMGLHFTLDGFRVLYGLVAALMWMMTTLFSEEYFKHYRNRNRYYLFNLLTLGATVGVFLSADLYTTFIFFEMMSFTSYVWVAQDERKESLRAAETYLAVAVIGGLVMLMGLFLLYHTIGTLDMASLLEACRACPDKGMLYAAGGCMLFGFGAKAGAFPLHIWLPKAHPVAPAPASALLSGILTKSGVFGILVVTCNIFLHDVTWGALILFLGIITMFGGALLAIFSVDLKRTLACSSMSQIGFILIGTGMQCLLGEENGLAVRGTLLHMVNHSLIKLVLFMAAGVVFMNLHKLNLNEICGFGRKKPLLNIAFLMGALGIGGIPLWNGYISKTLLHEAIVEARALEAESAFTTATGFAGFMTSGGMLRFTEMIFLISGGMTVAYMLKLYICLFIEKNADAEEQKRFDAMKRYMNIKSTAAILISALLLPILGCIPHMTMDRLGAMGDGFMHLAAETETVSYFGWESLKGGLVSIVIGIIIYFGIVRTCLMKRKEDGNVVYLDLWWKKLDLENAVYRPLLQLCVYVIGFFCRICDTFIDGVILLLRKTVYKESPIPYEREEGTFMTELLGSFADAMNHLLNKTIRRKQPKVLTSSYRHILAGKREELQENNMIVFRSLSFGLLLFCFGFIFTVSYILFRS